LALENITGEAFPDLFRESLVDTLQLNRTFLRLDNATSDPNAVIYAANGGAELADLGLLDR
jgi:CubicO group peptidase (beta-lactamase class C family)